MTASRTVRLETCMLSTMLFLALPGARLPVFPTAHFAKVAKLALRAQTRQLSRSNRWEKQRHLTISRLKTALVADFKITQKVYRTLLDGIVKNSISSEWMFVGD